MTVGVTPVKSVYVGSTPVTAVYVGAQKIWPTIEVHEVDVRGEGDIPLVQVSVPAGQTWTVRIKGTVTEADATTSRRPAFQIGSQVSGRYRFKEQVDFTGTITAANSTIAMSAPRTAAFVGTVTIEK